MSGLIGIYLFFFESPFLAQSEGRSAESQQPSSTSTAPSQSSGAGPGAAPADRAPSVECLDGGGQQTSCDLPHRTELVSSLATCERESVFAYLGGQSRVDSLRFAVEPQDRVCKITAPADVAGSFEQSSAGLESAVWRTCLDGSLLDAGDQRVVSCWLPHVAEVTSGAGALEASAQSCEQTAGQYVGRPWTELSDELRVELLPQSTQDDGRCKISIITGNKLNNTLRRLNNELLPRVR